MEEELSTDLAAYCGSLVNPPEQYSGERPRRNMLTETVHHEGAT